MMLSAKLQQKLVVTFELVPRYYKQVGTICRQQQTLLSTAPVGVSLCHI
jgi:hypothetical protein